MRRSIGPACRPTPSDTGSACACARLVACGATAIPVRWWGGGRAYDGAASPPTCVEAPSDSAGGGALA